MAENQNRLKKALGRLTKDEKRKMEEINEKIRAENFKLSILINMKLFDLRNFLKRRYVVVTAEYIEDKKLKIHTNHGFTQAHDPTGDDEFYLCSDKAGQEKECCGWVKGGPEKERYEHRANGKSIEGIKYKCFICQRIVGEKVL